MNEGPYTEFRYDNNGNRTTRIEPGDRVTTYTWDYENRLTEVNFHQDKWVGFEYDGDGNRITKLSAMTQPWHEEEIKQDNGKGNDPEFVPPGQQKAKMQRADLVYMLLKNDRGEGSKGKGNGGGSNGNGNDKDKPDNGKDNGNDKDKANNGKDDAKVKNKDLDKKDREEKKEKAKEKNGYRKKGKYENRGKHLGWYKNGKIPPEAGEKVEVTYYLNDVFDPLTQVLMTYNEEGQFDAAYTYGLERIEVEALDDTRPESQDPLYYLYDGLGSVTFMVKPDGNKRDHYRYDEFGKPAPGNSKLSEDGKKVLHNTFGYTGEMWDQESELLYLRARYYEPETGRFLSRDSYEGEIDNPLSRHLYTYVENNPVNYADPTGHGKLIDNYWAINSNHEVMEQINNLSLRWRYTDEKSRKQYENEADALRKKILEAQGIYVDRSKYNDWSTVNSIINGTYRKNETIHYTDQGLRQNKAGSTLSVINPAQQTVADTVSGPDSGTLLLSNRKPGKTPPKSWPPLPDNLAGKKPRWNPEGYWEGAKGNHTWDDRSHGSGVDRGYGPQDGHWDDEKSNGRWDRNGNPLPITGTQSSTWDQLGQITGLSGAALVTYVVISEGSRLFPLRNLVPVP